MPGIGNGSGWISFRDLMLMVGTLPAKLGTENTWSKNFRPRGIQTLISSVQVMAICSGEHKIYVRCKTLYTLETGFILTIHVQTSF